VAVFGWDEVVELWHVGHEDAVVKSFCRKTFLSVSIAAFLDARRDGVVLGDVPTLESTFLTLWRYEPVDDHLVWRHAVGPDRRAVAHVHHGRLVPEFRTRIGIIRFFRFHGFVMVRLLRVIRLVVVASSYCTLRGFEILSGFLMRFYPLDAARHWLWSLALGSVSFGGKWKCWRCALEGNLLDWKIFVKRYCSCLVLGRFNDYVKGNLILWLHVNVKVKMLILFEFYCHRVWLYTKE